MLGQPEETRAGESGEGSALSRLEGMGNPSELGDASIYQSQLQTHCPSGYTRAVASAPVGSML